MSRSSLRTLLVGLLAVMLLPPATAAAPWSGELSTPEMQTVGQSTTEGRLVVFLQENTLPDHIPGDPGFSLTADRMRVETDHSDLTLNTPAADYFHDVRTSAADHDRAEVTGITHRNEYQLSVWPYGGATVETQESTCASLSPTWADRVERLSLVGATRSPSTADTSTATTWSGCQDATLTIQGDFLLRLWEWDAELTADGETTFLPSGHRDHDGSPGGVPGLDAAVGQATEQFIYAYNATLTIPRLSGSYQLFMDDAEVSADLVRLAQATGSLHGPRTVDVARQDVELHGDLAFSVHNAGSRLMTSFRGDLDQVHLDGVPATLAPRQVMPEGSQWIMAGVVAAAVALVAAHQLPLAAYHINRFLGGAQGSVAPTTRRERRGVGFWVMARIDNQLGRHRLSRRHAERAHKAFPLFGEARLMAAVAESHLGRYKESVADFTDAFPRIRSPRARAMAACTAADACCRMGEPGLAREWLRNAAEADPGFTFTNVSSHHYDGLSDTEWFETWWALLRRRPTRARPTSS